MGEEGVKNFEKTADVLCEWPLIIWYLSKEEVWLQKITSHVSPEKYLSGRRRILKINKSWRLFNTSNTESRELEKARELAIVIHKTSS